MARLRLHLAAPPGIVDDPTIDIDSTTVVFVTNRGVKLPAAQLIPGDCYTIPRSGQPAFIASIESL